MRCTRVNRWGTGPAAALLTLALTLALTLVPEARAAGTWAVDRIELQGAAAGRALIDLTEPGRSAPRRVAVQTGAQLAAGSTVGVPAGTALQLRSPTGQLVSVDAAGGALHLSAAQSRGEAYEVRGGRWLFRVLARLDFFNVSARTVSAQTRGTVFSVELDAAGGQARFEVQEGLIQIRHPVLARIGTAQARLQARETLAAGEPARSYAVTPQDFLFTFGDYGDAQRYFGARLADAERAGDADATVDMLIALGDVNNLLGRPEEARPPYERALAMVRAEGDLYWQAVLEGRLGNARYRAGDYELAVPHYERSRQLHAQVGAPEGEYTVEEQGTNLAGALLARGTYRCAARRAEQVLAQLTAHYPGANHPSVAALRGVLGNAAYGLGAPARAAEQHQLALDIQRRLNAPLRRADGLAYHEDVAAALNALAWDHTALRRFAAAQRGHEDALAIARALFPGPHGLQADALHGLANLQQARGRTAEAVDTHRRALEILAAAPPDPIRAGLGQLYLGEALRAARQPQPAVEALQRAREALRTKFPDETHPYFVELYRGLAAAYRAWGGRADEARAADAQARAVAARVQEREVACLR
ncbi:MAG: tetratricopeptide repeat protein [Piscinibacter sp.]|uniref:tetratricopeptide repeat protein n=1 Tax=Piscinibacter TaxID=1114981 RepID=UPI0013E3B0BD|nr:MULTISPECIES: tetratricopeptide repeat protein [Piscinibacter]MCW5665244.1 tetratricopeptide repeat protein [Piscinibacter sp.]